MRSLKRDFTLNKYIYLMILPVILYYIIFEYMPMYGAIIAFKDFAPAKGILGSPWIGIQHFVDFINGPYFYRLVRNTLTISFLSILIGFPAPLLLALMLNEVKNMLFKRGVQTVTYIPHFISLVVVCGLIIDFTATYGVVNDIIEFFGGQRISMMQMQNLFRPIYIITDIWKECGWGSIIFIAALSGIDQQLYEAATIDGAGRWKRLLHVTLPSIIPTIVILLILRIGKIMNVGFEKIILLYNPSTYETADVISSYVYRKGLQEFSYSYSAAVGLFNSVINFTIIVATNAISKKVSEVALW